MKTIMKISELYVPMAALLLMAACSKGPGAESAAETALRMSPVVSYAPGNATRAVITTTSFPVNSEVGYIVIGSSDASAEYAGKPHLPGYDKISAVYTADAVWSYYVNAAYAGRVVAGYKTYGKIDVFGYYPYNASVSCGDHTAIPYEIGVVENGTATATEAQVTRDYMWATPVIGHTMTNEAVQMNFNHVMTCLRFNVQKNYVGPALVIKTLTFSMSNGRKFSLGGTYDATAAVPTTSSDPTKEVDKIVVNYNKTLPASNTSRYSCALIVPELRTTDNTDDAEMTVEFVFSDQEDDAQDPGGLDFHNGSTYKFKLSDVDNGAAGNGLLAGRIYNVNVNLSNFVKYSGTPKVVFPGWDADENHENSEPIEM